MTGPEQPGGRTRLPWQEVPAWLRTEAERLLGGRVVEAISQSGGFSPGAAARLRLDNGGRAFAKAVGPELNPDTPGMFRDEARTAAAMPASVPAPRLLGWIDAAADERAAAAGADGWVLLLYEEIDGAEPAQPWQDDELDRVLAALTELAGSLTPSPIEAPAVADALARAFRGWRDLAADPAQTSALDPWASAHLAELAKLESGWTDAAAGTTLAHADLRADNMLLTPDRVVFIDWSSACIAAPWFDLALMAPSIEFQGGPAAESVFTGHPLGGAAEPAAVTAVVAGMAGYYVRQSLRPPPPELPTLREAQAAYGRVTLDWLRARTGWQ
jgi:aminoglycoside phosphotransferase